MTGEACVLHKRDGPAAGLQIDHPHLLAGVAIGAEERGKPAFRADREVAFGVVGQYRAFEFDRGAPVPNVQQGRQFGLNLNQRPLQTRQDRQLGRLRHGQTRHQFRLAVDLKAPAPQRDDVGVCATAAQHMPCVSHQFDAVDVGWQRRGADPVDVVGDLQQMDRGTSEAQDPVAVRQRDDRALAGFVHVTQDCDHRPRGLQRARRLKHARGALHLGEGGRRQSCDVRVD